MSITDYTICEQQKCGLEVHLRSLGSTFVDYDMHNGQV